MALKDQQISIGSRVKLKSGSPTMTVVGYNKHADGEGGIEYDAKCYWYDENTGEIKTKSIPLVGLRPVKRKPS